MLHSKGRALTLPANIKLRLFILHFNKLGCLCPSVIFTLVQYLHEKLGGESCKRLHSKGSALTLPTIIKLGLYSPIL
jgi:hypothetical protein